MALIVQVTLIDIYSKTAVLIPQRPHDLKFIPGLD